MKFIETSQELNAFFLSEFRKHASLYGILAGANSNFPYFFELSDQDSKIKKLCIGLYNTDTSPTFINEFFTSNNVRYFYPTRGLSLLNLILFYSTPEDWSIIFGNFSLDQASFSDQPMGIWILDSRSVEASEIAVKFINQIDYYFERSFRFSEEEYENYWKEWDRTRMRSGSL